MNKSRNKGLIKILLDFDAYEADRDDAAMDMGELYDDDEVLEALITAARTPPSPDPNAPDMVLDSCGIAIANIWIKRNKFDKAVYESLAPYARHTLYDFIKSDKPEWIEQYKLIR